MGWPQRSEYATPPTAVARIATVAPSMPAVADVDTAPKAMAGASAAKRGRRWTPGLVRHGTEEGRGVNGVRRRCGR